MKRNPETGFPEFIEEPFRSIHARIMRDGYKSRNAGDMWEPEVRPTDIAELANRLLREEFEKWPIVYGAPKPTSSDPFHHSWSEVDTNNPNWTHQSRLMPPMPIRKESAEDVLRKLIQLTSNGGVLEYKGSHAGLQISLTDIVELAKRVLENK